MENKLSPLKTGAMSELKVCADLMNKGFDVFRAVAQNASCDIVAIRNNQVIRVEVRTTSESDNGNIRQAIKSVDVGRSDCYAWVTENGITYEPELETIVSIISQQKSLDNKIVLQNQVKLNKNALRLYSLIAYLNKDDRMSRLRREHNPYYCGILISEHIVCDQYNLFSAKALATAIRDLISVGILIASRKYIYTPANINNSYQRFIFELGLENSKFNIQTLEELQRHSWLYFFDYQKQVFPSISKMKKIN
jgi:PD-(D/E)XK endonuclease